MVFDAESKSVLHTEMAKKNLFVKRGELFVFLFFQSLFSLNKYLEDDTYALSNLCDGL